MLHMAINTEQKWHNLSIQDTAAGLETDLERGLSSAQVAQREAQFGPNALAERPRPGFLARLWAQLNDFLILILIVSAIISAVIGVNEFSKTGEMTEFIDAFAIMTIVVLNAVMGLVQEGRAEQALAALKKMSAPNATVIRDGRQQVVPALTLVPGDLVILETGNYVPADIRLLESVNLRVEEASLTGESVPVEKVADQIVDVDAGIGDRRNCG
jgi:Ca2+-transporting ATPase